MEPFTVSSLTTVLGRMLPEPHAGLLAGLLFGTKASLSRQLTDAFITTGTIHVVALSGQNVTMVAAVTATLLTVIVSRRIASLLTLLVLALYVWFVGPSPSLVRAVIMGSLSILAVVFGKRNWSLLSFILAVSIMLLLNPLWITDLGFQLSVLATLGIILFGGDVTPPHPLFIKEGETGGVIRKGFGGFIQSLRITLAAQLFTAPLIFFVFRRVSLIAPVTNVAIGWTMPFIMILGWAAATLGYLFLPLGVLPAWGSWVLLTFVLSVVDASARLPFAGIGW